METPTIQLIIKILSVLVFITATVFLVLPFFLLAGYSLKRLFSGTGKKQPFATTAPDADFGIIVTAHEDARFIDPIVQSLLKQTYPHFKIYVVADRCDISHLQYDSGKVSLLRPEEAINSKVKSIRYGISRFSRPHTAIVIFDSDNLVQKDFLSEINALFRQGYKAVQSDFKAKNLNTEYARMDAIGDMYNFFVDREARSALGLSAAIWGSGIAVDAQIYQSVTYQDDLGGFDKKLQIHIIKNAGAIGFTPNAYLFDEKIASGAALEKQRTRWMSSQFKYFKESLSLLFSSIARFNPDHFFFALNTLRPPLIVQAGLSFLMIFFNLLVKNYVTAAVFAGCILLYILSFIGIVGMRSKWNKQILATLFSLPKFAFRQFAALLKMSRAKKSFLKTQQQQVLYIEDVKDL